MRCLLSSSTVYFGTKMPVTLIRSRPACCARFSCARPDCQWPRAMLAAQASAAAASAHARGRKEYPPIMRYAVIAMLVLIVASLASALIFMLRNRDDPEKMAKALAIRVGLSVALFLMLMAGYWFGLFQPGKL